MNNLLEKFLNRFKNSSVNELKSWSDDPELSKILKKLQSVKEPQQFLDHYAEAMVAGYLKSCGCKLEVEVPTANNRTADLKVTKDNYSFFIHIKRLNTEGKTQKQMNIQSRLRDLESIEKPFTVAILFYRDLTDPQMQYFTKSISKFIKDASVGDTSEIVDDNSDLLGDCEIHSTNKSGHVLLVQTLSARFTDDESRLYDKLSDAYHQFMPEAINLIFVTSPWSSDIEDFESALLGSTYQKGRKNDGFWSDNKHPDSYIAAWFNFENNYLNLNFKTWYRENYKISEFITGLFENKF
jgi:hypothetical protein